MNLAELIQEGGFIPAAPEKKSLTWKRDSGDLTFDAWFIRPSWGGIERLGGDADNSVNAKMISQYVRLGKNAEESMTYEQAYQLDTSLALVFMAELQELAKPAKKSLPPMSSGASLSSTESVAEPLRKLKSA